MMKCLVTGGAGFIGSNLVDALLERGDEVIVVDNESADCHDHFYWNDRALNHKVDINDFKSLRPLFDGVDYVFHLAAEARIQPSLINPLQAVQTNVLGTANVLQASREAGVKRVMYSSTSSAYGLKNTPPLTESMPNDCLNPYSVSKTAGEELCKLYTRLFKLETVTFRYFNVYGLRQPVKGQYAPVLGLFLRQRNAGQPLTVVGDGLQRRDFTDVRDVVRVNMLTAACQNPEIVGETINVGTGKNHSVLDVSALVGGETTHIPERIGEARVTLASTEKMERFLDWKPMRQLEDWVNEYGRL
jgi:UDP-glucose 4-epimerase